jgi:hypothetical protein
MKSHTCMPYPPVFSKAATTPSDAAAPPLGLVEEKEEEKAKKPALSVQIDSTPSTALSLLSPASAGLRSGISLRNRSRAVWALR